MVERGGLEIRYTALLYPGFESLSFRNTCWIQQVFLYSPITKNPLHIICLLTSEKQKWMSAISSSRWWKHWSKFLRPFILASITIYSCFYGYLFLLLCRWSIGKHYWVECGHSLKQKRLCRRNLQRRSFLCFNKGINCHNLAERRGFEPRIPFWGIHAFQACLFNHSSIFPWVSYCLLENKIVVFSFPGAKVVLFLIPAAFRRIFSFLNFAIWHILRI